MLPQVLTLLKALIASANKTKAINRISNKYLRMERIVNDNISKGNLFFDTSLEKEAQADLLNLLHNTPALQTVLTAYHVNDETIIDIQAFMKFMGGCNLIKGHNMIVSPFAFPQTLEYLLSNKNLIRQNQNTNLTIYYTVYNWFKYGCTKSIENISNCN